MHIGKIRTELREGKTIDEVCREYNMSFSKLLNTLRTTQSVPRKEENLPDYIYIVGNRYEIRKVKNKKIVTYGSYNHLGEALKVRDELILKEWNESPDKYLGDKFIYPRTHGFLVQKTMDKKTYHCGFYESISDARKVRDKLVECNWDFRQLNNILKELGVEPVYGN